MPAAAEIETETQTALVPPAAEPGTQAELLETVRALPAESQRAVLSYAQFLQYQEEARLEAWHDAEWERLLNDPVKTANFARWAEEHANGPSEPLDFSKL